MKIEKRAKQIIILAKIEYKNHYDALLVKWTTREKRYYNSVFFWIKCSMIKPSEKPYTWNIIYALQLWVKIGILQARLLR